MRTTQHVVGRATDELVETLLESMDLEEKLHQLGSYWRRDTSQAAPAPDPEAGQGAGHSGAAPLEHDFAERSQQWEEASRLGLGHLTRVFGTAPLSVEEGVARLVALQEEVRARSPHRIPAIAHEECLTGFTALGATVYPAAIAG
ncbi:MAG: hypothetical protein L0H81_08025, partial [Actinomyces sp.]|nr:hypothetical protein [Actinomyces sp.]